MDNLYYSFGEYKGALDARFNRGMRDLNGWDASEAQGYIDGYNSIAMLAA